MKMRGERETRVILVRHAKTEWNRVERCQGRMDIELSDTCHLEFLDGRRV